MADINYSKAEQEILSAFENENKTISDSITEDIITVLRGNHKTYRYILLTGILAKATNAKINALSLQAKATIDGAYDARSLCHKIIVPFERKYLENVLGGSNEPFLNKPARFPILSDQNAVRAGNDKILLLKVIEIFNQIHTSESAKLYLHAALSELKVEMEENRILGKKTYSYNPNLLEISNFIHELLKCSFEGEVCSIVVGTIEKLYHEKFKVTFEVFAHKVNQSGSSSKEVGDIDIYREGNFYYSVEVKDKDFNEYDLGHAFDKMRVSGAHKGQFVFGPQASFDNALIQAKLDEFQAQDFMVWFIDIYTYCQTMLFKMDFVDKSEFLDTIFKTAKEINCKKETNSWIHSVILEQGWDEVSD